MIFKDGVIPAISESITRAKIQSEEFRRAYTTELLDIYSGFGMKYLKELIATNIKNEGVRTAMANLAVNYPILQNFINKLSMVYKYQPVRRFYLDGKEIIEEPSDESLIDPDKYEVNTELKKTLNNIYSKDFCMRIKQSEVMTNLLNTTIYKINNREGKMWLDFIPNDQCSIIPSPDDITQMNSIYFLRGTTQITDIYGVTNLQPVYEYWSLAKFELNKGGKSIEEENRAMTELIALQPDTRHIGSGFPPFVVLRSHIAEEDFWSTMDKDIVDTIKQINLALTELRYLQRYGAFGLKYVINAQISQDAVSDPTGIMEILSASKSKVPGDDAGVQVGEFSNTARMTELADSVFQMIRFLYSLKNISLDTLISSGQISTAESKLIDKMALKELITSKQEIWEMNEDTIFKTAICVYNRDNTSKLPKGLEIKVDFHDIEQTADEVKADMEAWLIKIENDVATKIDWMRSMNSDLNEKEAASLIERNMQINQNNSVTMPAEESEEPMPDDDQDIPANV